MGLGWAKRTWQALHHHRSAYGFVAPAMVGMVLLVFLPVLGMQALPEASQEQIGAWAMTIGVDGLLWVAAALLALIDLALLVAAFARFRRSRLVLD